MISEKKKALPAAGEDGTRPSSPLDAEIKELEGVRQMLSITSTNSTPQWCSEVTDILMMFDLTRKS